MNPKNEQYRSCVVVEGRVIQERGICVPICWVNRYLLNAYFMEVLEEWEIRLKS